MGSHFTIFKANLILEKVMGFDGFPQDYVKSDFVLVTFGWV
jgi:hypothetical protein